MSCLAGRLSRPVPRLDPLWRLYRMKLRLLAATLVALTLTGGTALAQDTSSSKGQLSYALGFQFGSQLYSSGEGLDINTVIKAVQDGYAKKTPAVPVDQ